MNNPGLYANFNEIQKQDALWAIQRFFPSLTWNEDEEKILDIGCGSGCVLETLIRPAIPKFASITAIDKSAEMVQYCKSRADNVDYKQIDIEAKLDFNNIQEGCFSKVFSFYCFHWIKNLDQATKNVYRLLQPGGEVLLVFLSHCPLFTVYRRLSKYSKWSKYMKEVDRYIPVFHDCSKADKKFSAVINKAGLEIITCEVIRRNFTSPSSSYTKCAIKAVDPFIHSIPKEFEESYFSDCLREMNQFCHLTSSNQLQVEYEIIVAHCRK